jgi:hypothetical protein
MSLEMMSVAILRATCKLCCFNRFAMPGVAIWKEHIVIHALGTGMLLKGERVEYPPEYLVQHLSVWLVLVIPPLLTNIEGLDQDRQESDH